MPDTSHTTFPPWILPIITGIIGFIVALIIEKFKNRVVLLKFKKNVFQIATSTNHRFWGNIEVLYNNRKTTHLSLVTIEVKNDSNIDLENVSIDLWTDESSQILAQQGNHIESGNLILLEEGYKKSLNEILELNDEDISLRKNNPDHKTPPDLLRKIHFVTSNMKLNLSVFNRSTSIRIQVLVENFESKVPLLSFSILHRACKLISEIDEIERERKQNRIIAIIWLLLFGLGTGIIYWKLRNNTLAVVWTGVLGFISLFIAAWIYRSFQLVKKIWH